MLHPHPVNDFVAPAPSRPEPASRLDRALISDEEWQALLWPTVTETGEVPASGPASETVSGALS